MGSVRVIAIKCRHEAELGSQLVALSVEWDDCSLLEQRGSVSTVLVVQSRQSGISHCLLRPWSGEALHPPSRDDLVLVGEAPSWSEAPRLMKDCTRKVDDGLAVAQRLEWFLFLRHRRSTAGEFSATDRVASSSENL